MDKKQLESEREEWAMEGEGDMCNEKGLKKRMKKAKG